MTLQQLKYVTTIANIGSISEAAKRLFVSQPSLTKAIKELENIRNEYEMTEMCKFDEQYRLNTSYRRFCYQLSQENDKELIECPF